MTRAIVELLLKLLEIITEIFRTQQKKQYDDEIDQIHKNPGDYFDDHFGRVSDNADKTLRSDKTPKSE